LASAFLWEYSYKGLKLAQLPGQLGVFLTWMLKFCAIAASPMPFSQSRATLTVEVHLGSSITYMYILAPSNFLGRQGDYYHTIIVVVTGDYCRITDLAVITGNHRVTTRG
jgi:hypothetical protein